MDDHNLRLHEGYHTADGAQTVDPFTNGSLKRRIWAVINGNNMLIVFIIVALSVSSLSSVRLDGPKSISNIFPKEGLDIPTNHVSCLPSLEACTACPTCSAPTCPTCSACDECFTAPECAKSVPEVNCEETAAYHALHNRLHDCQSLITLQKSDCTKTVELQQLVLNADQFVEALQIQLAIAEREREELKLKLVSTDQQWFAIKERMEHAYEHIQKLHAEATYSSDHVKHLKSQISTFEDSLSHFTESVATSLILNFEESAKEVPMIMENAVRSGMITNDGIRDFVSPIEAISAIIDNIAHVSVQYMIKEIDMRIESFFATIEQPAVAVPATDRPAVIETAAVAAAAVGVAAPVMDTPVQDEVNRRDFALAAAGATVVRERTSPTFFPPFLRVDNKIKNFLNSIGLDGLNSMVPNFSGRVAYDALGIVPNVGMPTEVLNGNLDVGSCWPMNVRIRFEQKATNRSLLQRHHFVIMFVFSFLQFVY